MMRASRLFAITFVALVCAGCSEDTQTSSEVASNDDRSQNNQARLSKTADLSSSDIDFVCRAAIAEIMGRDIAIMEATKVAVENKQIMQISYVRPSDNTRWTQHCYLEGDDVIWAGVENGVVGRWRNHPNDESIKFKLSGDKVTISQIFGDGSSISDTFSR